MNRDWGAGFLQEAHVPAFGVLLEPRRHRRTSALVLWLALLCLVASGVSLLVAASITRNGFSAINRVVQIRLDAEVLLSEIKDVETGQRGFLVTGDAAFLDPYNEARPRIASRLNQLIGDATAVDATFVLESLRALVGRKLDLSDATVAIVHAGNLDRARLGLEEGEGKRVMDAIRDEIAAVSARLDQRRSSIERRTKRVATVAASFALAGAVLASAMIGITALLQGRRSAERLRLVEETRDLTLDAAGLGTWEWDWRTERITLSARTASLFALPANTPLPPKTVFSAIRADAQNDAERALRGAGELGGCDWEGAVGQHPASSRVVHLRAGLYRDGAGRPTVLRGVAQDVTFRREAEQRARELDVELLHAGRLSTVGETAAATAHELSQPLSAASTFVQSCHTILRSGMDYDRDEMVAILARGLDALGRASDIVRNLRRFLRKEAPATEQVDLNSAVRDAVPLAAIGFERRANGRLMWDLAGGVPTIEADKTQIQQVVVNLVRNAIDAMADSPVRELRIGTEQVNGRVRLSVADTGPGLPEEIREAPFRPFKTTKPNGLGLGLSISKSIVEAHGGTIEVASGPRGTVFSVDLPSSTRAGDGNGD